MRIPADTLARFWAKVNKTDTCWLWTASSHRQGYGNFWLNGNIELAHRVSWIIHKGEIPNDLKVCHTCDNPACVNPAHLFLGTQKDNVEDMINKGRAKRPVLSGERHGRAKVSDADRDAIRNLYSTGQYSQVALGEMFGISQSAVSKIVRQSNA